jgi:hypothetical protein
MKKLLVLALAIPLASVASAAPKASTPARLVTKRPVAALAADGGRAALVIPGRGADPARRWQILVWEPASHRLLTIHTERDAYPGGRRRACRNQSRLGRLLRLRRKHAHHEGQFGNPGTPIGSLARVR